MRMGVQGLSVAHRRGGPDRRAVVTTAGALPAAADDGPHRVAAAGCRSDQLTSGPPVTLTMVRPRGLQIEKG